MCSEPSNHQNLLALGDPSSSSLVGEPESETSNRGNFNPPPVHLTNLGMRYMNLPDDDNRFSPESVGSHSTIYSLEPSIQNTSQSSSLPTSSYNCYLPPTQNFSTYSNNLATGSSTYYTPTPLYSSMPDSLRPSRFSSIGHSSSSLTHSRGSSAHSPHISPPLSSRDLYASNIPGSYRQSSDLLARSPPIPVNLRSAPISPTSTSGFASPNSNMNESLGKAEAPPLCPTEVHYTLTTSDGQMITPEIFGRIDKGFFMADNDWTCYRRNYFSLNCSFTLSPVIPTQNLYVQIPGAPILQVHAFSMSIAAVVDGRNGKSIELVQHTPKRDKGPQEKPARIVLAPRPPASHTTYDGTGDLSGIYDSQGFNPTSGQPATEATFERIQFKNATANNGKRRAAQQYYHLLVDLFADVGDQHVDRHIKIASRISAQMVVRGRSPGHYQNERRGSSNTSNGPGGSNGTYTPSANLGRSLSDFSMSGGLSPMLHGSSFNAGYDGRSQYRCTIPSLHGSMDANMSPEEAKQIEESSCYMYYPSPIWENSEPRYHLPAPEYALAKTKNDFSHILPSLCSGTSDGVLGLSLRHCGRWEGFPESRGYFPSALTQHEMNMT